MKKKMISTVMAVIMAATLFVGCGKPAESMTSSAQPEKGSVTEITWLNHFEEDGIKKWMQEMITSFEAQNPDIKINVETISYSSYDQTLKTKIASDDAPMLFDLAGQAYYEEYVKAGHLYDVTGIEGIENIGQGYLPDGQVEGKQYAIPLDVNGYAIFYNKAIFDKYNLQVPKTVSELTKICEVLTENGVQPFAAPMQELWGLQEYVDVAGFPVFGTKEWFTEKMNLSSSFAEDKKFEEAIKNYYSFKQYWGEDPFGTNWDTAQNMVANGEAAMVANGSWAIDGITAKNPDCEVRVFAMPTSEDPSGSIMVLRPGNGICLYNSEDEAKMAAGKKFYSWLLSKESGESYAKNGFKISTVEGVDLSFSPGLSDIQSYTGDQVWNSSGIVIFPGEFYQAFYETIQNYTMEDTLDMEGLEKSLDEAFAAASK